MVKEIDREKLGREIHEALKKSLASVTEPEMEEFGRKVREGLERVYGNASTIIQYDPRGPTIIINKDGSRVVLEERNNSTKYFISQD